jgi:lipopolysaccharide biosynthesis protein
MGEVFDKYKYLCHIHSKKSLHLPELWKKWRTYLFNNLLGTTEIISEILSDFENNESLGIIFPENYYKILEYTMNVQPKEKEKLYYL